MTDLWGIAISQMYVVTNNVTSHSWEQIIRRQYIAWMSPALTSMWVQMNTLWYIYLNFASSVPTNKWLDLHTSSSSILFPLPFFKPGPRWVSSGLICCSRLLNIPLLLLFFFSVVILMHKQPGNAVFTPLLTDSALNAFSMALTCLWDIVWCSAVL